MSDALDLGPLAALVGTWYGDRGTDIAPEPDGDATSAFYETITFDTPGDVDNAETQDLVFVRYRQVVQRKSNDKIFHNESGYLIWDAEQQLLMQSLTIPRGLALVAGGSAEVSDEGVRLQVRAGDADWPIAESPFMRDNAHTQAFEHTIEVRGDVLSYREQTDVDIYGKRFVHTDENTLTRVD